MLCCAESVLYTILEFRLLTQRVQTVGSVEIDSLQYRKRQLLKPYTIVRSIQEKLASNKNYKEGILGNSSDATTIQTVH